MSFCLSYYKSNFSSSWSVRKGLQPYLMEGPSQFTAFTHTMVTAGKSYFITAWIQAFFAATRDKTT